MKKSVFSFLILFICSFCLSQTSLGKFEIKGFQYEVHSDFVEDYQIKKEVYRISRLENDSIVQSVSIDKHVKNEMEEINSEFQLLDDVFVFEKQQVSNGQTFYGVDRVFVGNNGKLYKHDEKYFSPNKPNLNTYDAQFPGGRKGLENWVRNRFDSNDFARFANEGESTIKFQIKFTVEENGKISNIEVSGKDSWKSKAMEIMERMPDWFPAVENGVKVKAIYNLPIHMVVDF